MVECFNLRLWFISPWQHRPYITKGTSCSHMFASPENSCIHTSTHIPRSVQTQHFPQSPSCTIVPTGKEQKSTVLWNRSSTELEKWIRLRVEFLVLVSFVLFCSLGTHQFPSKCRETYSFSRTPGLRLSYFYRAFLGSLSLLDVCLYSIHISLRLTL